MSTESIPNLNYFDKAYSEIEKINDDNCLPSSEERLCTLGKILSNIELGNKTETIPLELFDKLQKKVLCSRGLKEQKNLAIKMLELLGTHKSSLSKSLMTSYAYVFLDEFLKDLHFDYLDQPNLELQYFSPRDCEFIIRKKLLKNGVPFEIKSGDRKTLETTFALFPREQEIAFVLQVETLFSETSSASPHIIPLIIRSVDDEIEILCLDSIGGSTSDWNKILVKFLNQQKFPVKLFNIS